MEERADYDKDDGVMDQRLFALLCVGLTIGAGLVSGVFFGFSSFVMPALGRLPPSAGIAAMRSINVAVVPSAFIVVFMLTSLASAGACLSPLVQRGAAAWLAVGAGLFMVIGAFGVTMACNVPMNDALAQPGASQSQWATYLVDWTRWNTVRAVASLVSAVGFGLAAHVAWSAR